MAKKEGGAVPTLGGMTAPDLMLGAGAAMTATGAMTPHEHMLMPVGITIGAIGGAMKIFDGWL